MSTPTYDGPERRESELHDLRLATERLSDQVATLSLALQVVNVLQGKQQDMEAEAAEQRDLTNLMVEQVSTDTDANARSRRHFWRRVLPAALAIAASFFVLFLVNDARFRRNCHIRNEQAAATDLLLQRAAANVPPGPYRDQLMATDRVYQPVDCSLF